MSQSTANSQSTPLPLGQLVATPGAIEAMARAAQDPAELLERHRRGDWGDVDATDAATNDAAVHEGHRILSAFPLKGDTRVWIITEADRSCTTMLLPCEY